jgi:hypothetical protein
VFYELCFVRETVVYPQGKTSNHQVSRYKALNCKDKDKSVVESNVSTNKNTNDGG